MADYTQNVWVDKSTPAMNAADLNVMEAGIKDAAQNSKQRGSMSSRPAAAAANKNWIWVEQSTGGQMYYSDGSNWIGIGDSNITALAAATGNVNIASPPSNVFDGVTVGANAILLWKQTTASENGIYVFNGVGTPMTRANVLSIKDQFWQGRKVYVTNGDQWGSRTFTNLFAVTTLGTTSITFQPDDIGVTLTALPANPVDGQEINYLADSTNGVVWRLKYRAGSGSSYKWEFIGGPPLYAEITAAQVGVFGDTAYHALTTAGPVVTLPLAGDFDIEIGCRAVCAGTTALMSYDIGGTGAVDADAIEAQDNDGANNIWGNYQRLRRKTALTAVALTAKYKTANGGTNPSFASRWMSATPVRVG